MTLPNVPETTQVVGTSGSRALPRVNLLPPEIHEAAKFRRFQFAMAAAGVGAVAIVGVLAYSAHHSVQNAQSAKSAAEATHASLQNQLAGLQSVKDVYAQVDARKAMLAQAMGGEVRWSYYLNDISLKVPDHVWLTTVTASTGATATSGVAPSVATPSLATPGVAGAVGSLTFQGVAFSHDDVATWLDMLAKERGFTNVYFTNSSQTYIGPRAVDDFTSSSTLTPAALSGRYTAEG